MKDIEDEIPFEVPEGWVWTKLGHIFSHNTGKALNKSKLDGEYHVYLTTSNVYWDYFDLNTVSSMPFTESELPKCTITKGDLLICEGGDIGRSNIWDKDYDICIQNHLHRLRAYLPVETKLFYYWLMLFKQQNMIVGKGIGLMGFSSNLVHNLIIPLPPLEEQKQIVKKIEAIFSQIKCLENGKDELQTAIKHAKSKILDLAIHGKLVPQDPSEEPAGKLLEKIRAEKEAKIAAGELKRDKNDSYIYKNPSDNCHYRKYDNHQEECIESEIAFSLPESWQWVNLGGIFAHNTGKALNKSKLEGEYKDYITTSNVYWDRFELNNVSKMPFTPEEMKKCTVTKGDLLICEGGDVGRSNIWDKDYDICIQNHLHRLRAFVPVETKLFYYWLMLFKQHNMIIGKGIGLMGFSSSLVHNLLIPLPPLSEQKRIVTKIEEMFSCLENIENNIT